MVAKAAGILAGVLIMVVWFWLIGTRPVMETVVGLLLGIGGGLWVWRVIGRQLRGGGK